MRPRIAETESSGLFFSGEFGWRVDNRPQRISVFPGVSPGGVVNAPELVAGRWRHSRVQFHAAI